MNSGGKGECDQDDGAPAPAAAADSTSISTAAAIITGSPYSNYPVAHEGDALAPPPSMLTPPVPDSQIIALYEEMLMNDEEDEATGWRSAEKKPRGQVDLMDDEGPPAPFPAGNDEGKTKKRPELIEDDNDSPADYFANLHDEGGGNLKKKPAAAPEPVTRPQPQPNVMPAPPFRPHQAGIAAPRSRRAVSRTWRNRGVQDQASTIRPLVRPTPQSMLPRPSIASDTRAPSLPIIEARLVEDDPTVLVYEATIVRDNIDIERGQSNNTGTNQPEAEAEPPWCKKYQRSILIGIVAVLSVILIVVGTLFATQGRNGDGGNANNEAGIGILKGSVEPTARPTILLDSKEQTTNPTLLDQNVATVEGLFDPPSDNSSAMPLESNSTEEEPVYPSSDEVNFPSESPTETTTDISTDEPATLRPSKSPTAKPTNIKTDKPTTSTPSKAPTAKPTQTPTRSPTKQASQVPSTNPTVRQMIPELTDNPTISSTIGQVIPDLTVIPTISPISGQVIPEPTDYPTTLPPSKSPTIKPTKDPTSKPTLSENSILSSQTKLLANDGAAGDLFGKAVSVSGDTVVVGAPGDDDNGEYSGSAYVFIRDGNTWTQQAKLLPNEGSEYDWFGASLALNGDTVVVGAYLDDNNGNASGSAYVFIRKDGTWKQQAKLLPNDGAADDDSFGIAVSASGDTVVIGAYQDDDNGSSSGAVYLFIRNGDAWTQQAKFLPNDGAADDWFGWSVGVSKDTVVVGAQFDDDNGISSGSAYVFFREGDTWTQQAKLLPNDGAAYDEFGTSVSVNGDTIVVGARFNDDNGSLSGSAYVFIRDGDTWKQQDKLLPNDGAALDEFGYSVSVSGDTVVVGASQDDDNGSYSGSAYVFSLQS